MKNTYVNVFDWLEASCMRSTAKTKAEQRNREREKTIYVSISCLHDVRCLYSLDQFASSVDPDARDLVAKELN